MLRINWPLERARKDFRCTAQKLYNYSRLERTTLREEAHCASFTGYGARCSLRGSQRSTAILQALI